MASVPPIKPPAPSAPQPREPIGHVAVRPYGKYYLVKKLAEGGMAEIFLAKQVGVEGFEKNVVIKRMLQHLSGVPDFVAMFLDEARLAASLSHANIVQISDLGMADGCYYICMEYLAGEDFSTVLRTAKRRNETVPLHVVLRVIAEAASGLHFAHEYTDTKGRQMNVVHRDISPSNIFVTYSGQVKVLDFGIAKAESRVTNTTAGIVKGKYQYMSPEQAQSQHVDRRSDVYSLGVSLYEALTLTRPFARDTDLAILNAVLKNSYVPLRQLRPDLPQEIEAIVTRAMALNASDRYDSAADMAADIERTIGAMTSASGGTALSSFMKGFFGDERVKSKLRIETLEELAARGVDVPGMDNPFTPKTDPALRRMTAEQKAITDPVSFTVPPPGNRTALLVGALVAAVVVGIGGTLAAVKLFKNPPVDPDGVFDAGPDEPEPIIDAGLVAEPQFDAGTAQVTEDAGLPKPPVVDVGTRPVKAQCVVLSGPMIARGVKGSSAKLTACLTKFKSQLPDAKGKIVATLTIVGSGAVTTVETEMKGTPLGACLESVIKAIRFPCHVDSEVRMSLPLGYDNSARQ